MAKGKKTSEDVQTLGLSVKKSENISEWYTQAMQKADMADYTSVSGCLVFKPRSYSIWEKIVQETDKRFKAVGIKNAYFPLLIPATLLEKEATHLEGFTPEVAWVTHAGSTELNERLAVRPTSETIMYESYSKWIRSWRDLPLRLNQWNNVVRWEFKNPVPFLRTREFLWNEGHTVFATKEEAEAERDVIIGIYDEIMTDFLALPSLIGKKTESEKFAGAEYTISMEQYLPSGRAIQGPDFHHDGQIFAKAFDITFQDQDGNESYAWQNTFAITTRVIGIMLMMHGDDKGLIIPPRVAETQVGIVPILFGDDKKVIEEAQKVRKELADYAVELNERDEYSAGYKFNDLELRGVPLRIEIGPKDIEKDQVVIVRRDTGEKAFVARKDVKKKVAELLDAIHDNLYKKAKQLLDDNIVEAKTMDALKQAIKEKKIAKVPFCNVPDRECEDYIKEETGGAGPRNMPLDQKPIKDGKCVWCGKEAKEYAYFAKSY
jgi:prolyl-tRNA synthetase